MGMYDSIKVKRDLPLPEEVKHLDINWKEIEHQTKSFDNCLSEYVIEEDGSLFETVIEREYIAWTDEERKKQKPKTWQLFKDVIIKKQELVPQDNFHGTVRFYCYEKFDEDNDFFIDYDAFYTYGKLDKISLVEFGKYKNNAKDIIERMQKEQSGVKRVLRIVKKYTGWSWCCWRISRILLSVSRCLDRVRIFIYKIE
jgi:hypothetical protein